MIPRAESIKFTNSLTNEKEVFVPMNGSRVDIYTCGPTVYDYVTIGNWRTYTLSDIVIRTLQYFGYDVIAVMNITDVGHLTGDNEGDASTGEDRMEKAARREGKNAWDVAEFYTQDFFRGFKDLNLTQPITFAKATEHINEQIELIKQLERHGYTYKIPDGIYFDVAKYEADGSSYGDLSPLDQIKEGARVEPNEEKHDPRDFALWKFSPEGTKRDMEWDSPWGTGFPGWHIECSAMSMKYLGEQFDIHVGGEDLRHTHHPNEIAQSESASGKKPFVAYWLHGAFLLVDGGRMGKSLSNAYTLHDIEGKGFSPLALRYFYLSGHYRKQLNFTWEALQAAQNALDRFRRHVSKYGTETGTVSEKYTKIFDEALADDLNTPEALAVAWNVVRDTTLSSEDKRTTLLHFDQVLGLDIGVPTKKEIPQHIKDLMERREDARSQGDYHTADKLREQIRKEGFEVSDPAS